MTLLRHTVLCKFSVPPVYFSVSHCSISHNVITVSYRFMRIIGSPSVVFRFGLQYPPFYLNSPFPQCCYPSQFVVSPNDNANSRFPQCCFPFQVVVPPNYITASYRLMQILGSPLLLFVWYCSIPWWHYCVIPFYAKSRFPQCFVSFQIVVSPSDIPASYRFM